MESPFNPSRLIAARQRAKFSKKDLATRIDVTQKSISLYEDGRQPSPATLAKLARALGVPPGFSSHQTSAYLRRKMQASVRSHG